MFAIRAVYTYLKSIDSKFEDKKHVLQRFLLSIISEDYCSKMGFKKRLDLSNLDADL